MVRTDVQAGPAGRRTDAAPDPRFPCGITSPTSGWRLSRTLLSVRDPERRTHRLAGLHSPLAGVIADDGTSVILDRVDPVAGRHLLAIYGPNGRLVRTQRVSGRRVHLDADLEARLLFLLVHRKPYDQTMSAHVLDDGRCIWRHALDLEHPELRIDPRRRAVTLRHALLPPRFPYVAQYGYDGRLLHRLPRDGPTALDLAETALSLGRPDTARILFEHAREAPLPEGLHQRVAELSSRLDAPPDTSRFTDLS